MARCPTCRRHARTREDNPAFPFCSPRCRAIDLGKWFTEAYRLPEQSSSEEREPAKPEDDSRDR